MLGNGPEAGRSLTSGLNHGYIHQSEVEIEFPMASAAMGTRIIGGSRRVSTDVPGDQWHSLPTAQ